MGYRCHHIIAVTSQDAELLNKAHEQAMALFQAQVTPILNDAFNGYCSFFVGPDGASRTGTESQHGDRRRNDFKAWLQSETPDEVGSDTLQWVEVQYGDEELETKVTDDSDAPLRNAYAASDDRGW